MDIISLPDHHMLTLSYIPQSPGPQDTWDSIFLTWERIKIQNMTFDSFILFPQHNKVTMLQVGVRPPEVRPSVPPMRHTPLPHLSSPPVSEHCLLFFLGFSSQHYLHCHLILISIRPFPK